MPTPLKPEMLVFFSLPEAEIRELVRQAVRDALSDLRNDQPDELLSLAEVRKILGCSKSTLWLYRRKGYLSTVTYGKKVFVRRGELMKVKKRQVG